MTIDNLDRQENLSDKKTFAFTRSNLASRSIPKIAKLNINSGNL